MCPVSVPSDGQTVAKERDAAKRKIDAKIATTVGRCGFAPPTAFKADANLSFWFLPAVFVVIRLFGSVSAGYEATECINWSSA